MSSSYVPPTNLQKLQYTNLSSPSPVPDNDKAECPRQQSSIRSKTELSCFVLFPFIAMFFSVFAMWVEVSPICYLAFSMTFISAPIVIRQRHQIVQLGTFRLVHNALRDTVNSLVSEQRNLESQINYLTNNIKRLKVTERRLIKVVEKERGDINFFTALAKENSSTLEKIKSIEKAMKLQRILTTIINSDLDGNFEMNEKELNASILRLKAEGLNENLIRNAIGSSKSMHTLVCASFNIDNDAPFREEEVPEMV